MTARQIASRPLPLALALLLIAVGAATAGDYSPRHLRAESFLERPVPYRERVFEESFQRRDIPIRIGLDYRLGLAPTSMILRLEAKPGLRRLVRIKLEF